MEILSPNKPKQAVFASPAKITVIRMCCEKKKTQKAEAEAKKEWEKKARAATKNKKAREAREW